MSPAPLPRNRKPDFIRREAHYRPRVKKRWRYPDGIHSPLRQYHKSRPALPTPGYGRAAALRGLHPSGKKPILVHTLRELQHVRPEEGAFLAKPIGRKKRLEMLAYAQQKGIVVLGVGDISAKLEALRQKVIRQKEQKAQRKAAKKESVKPQKKSSKKVTAKPESATPPIPAERGAQEAPPTESDETASETIKDREREMMEKTLTKRQ